MANDLHHPHDKLFRTVFSDTTEAADFLRRSVPETLSREPDWSTLFLLDGSFIDEVLRESESALLYQIEHGPSQEPVQVYILFEHQLLAALPPSGGVDYLRVFVRYVVATQDTEAVKAFGEALQRHAAGSGGEIMTYAQELLQEGERKGRQEGRQEGKQEGERKGKIEGQIETIENFLKAGVGWAVIESATGIDEKQLAALKQQLAGMTH